MSIMILNIDIRHFYNHELPVLTCRSAEMKLREQKWPTMANLSLRLRWILTLLGSVLSTMLALPPHCQVGLDTG